METQDSSYVRDEIESEIVIFRFYFKITWAEDEVSSYGLSSESETSSKGGMTTRLCFILNQVM